MVEHTKGRGMSVEWGLVMVHCKGGGTAKVGEARVAAAQKGWKIHSDVGGV